MKNKIFWNWKGSSETEERTLFLGGTIAEETWWGDEVTPQKFKEELNSGDGNITVWINSYGGDCFAAAQIYNMLVEYPGKVTVKIDGIAASAASVIAMAGDKVIMSPVSTIMIHNPSTMACGDHTDMKKAIDILDEIKESIINAYAIKTGLSRAKLSHLMDDTTWMNANKAVELGFADEIITKDNYTTGSPSNMFSQKTVSNALVNKITSDIGVPESQTTNVTEYSVVDIMEHLDTIKKYII